MPRVNEVLDLLQLSIDTFVESVVTTWFNSKTLNIEYHETALKTFLEEQVPKTVLDRIVAQIINLYVTKYRVYVQEGYDKSSLPTVSNLLHVVTIPGPTSLNFASVVCVDAAVQDFHEFEEIFISSLPLLKNIVNISMPTHSVEVTLPICTDNILRGIGENCPNLKSLNISFNTHVTDVGLQYLIPSQDWTGCQFLEDIYLQNCTVTPLGVCNLLEGLHNLQRVRYKKLAVALFTLYQRYMKKKDSRLSEGLKLTHVNIFHCSLKNPGFSNVLNAIAALCPNVQNLKLCMLDFCVPELIVFKRLRSLEIIFHLALSFLPGNGTEIYLRNCGGQLTILALVSGSFKSSFFKQIGRDCLNLSQLWLRCNHLLLDCDLIPEECDGQNFRHLESLYFRVGEHEHSECGVPVNILKFILQNSCLKELRIIARNIFMTDMWLKELWESFSVFFLERVLIAIPRQNTLEGVLNLSLESVLLILELSPNLVSLENLLVWNVTKQEHDELILSLKARNLTVNITYCSMKIS